ASGFGRVLPRLLDLETPSSLSPRQALFTHIEDRIAVADYDRDKILIAIHPQHHEIWYWLIPFSNGRSSLAWWRRKDFLTNAAASRWRCCGKSPRRSRVWPNCWRIAASTPRPTVSAAIPPTSKACTARATPCWAMPGSFSIRCFPPASPSP
ncbi:NAD(P)/FAD-dependent oxidoreductase, partial [Methylogaea oryzae]|uniref:NAD(P)/FAD-dependent oxidoreductase n=1 Tax=Methylogaea oryzae TaxID=1295382 RepID=UPI0035713733